MTMGEFEDLCVRVQREYGDAFPLSRLTDAGGISAVVDPLTSRCFLLLEDGLATISIFYDFEGADNVPWVARPGDYFMCDTGDVQAELTS
ncbi:MAG: hypothetical protein U9R79_13910, partial [Armatimonadota bacterium]|nr:hypothetical protein [Armatimonadota bacterium]